MNEIDKTSTAAVHAADEAKTLIDTEKTTFYDWISQYITWNTIMHIIGTAIIVCIMYLVYKLIYTAIKRISPEKLRPSITVTLKKASSYIFYISTVLYVLSAFGVRLSAIWEAAGVAGIAIGFAAQTSISNVISGIFVLSERAIKQGDFISVGTATGTVDAIGLLAIRIHTTDNQMIRIPNASVLSSNLTNTSYFSTRKLIVNVDVGYSTDIPFALDQLKKVPELCPHTLLDPAPDIWIDKFGDSGIRIILAVWFEGKNYFTARNEIFIAIKKICDDALIEIPYNKLDVSINSNSVIHL